MGNLSSYVSMANAFYLKCHIENSSTSDYYNLNQKSSSICKKNSRIPELSGNFSFECEIISEVPDELMLATPSFWIFVVLMSVGTIAFNVVNSVSDAICFDVIGEKYDYGKQRSWGALGYGTTALLSGYVIDNFANGRESFQVASGVMLLFVFVDLMCCLKLNLPVMPAPENIWTALGEMMKNRAVCTFLVFTVLIGSADGFLTYFLFWYIEDIAEIYGAENVKLLEGSIVAAGTLGGSILFFQIGDNILKKLGHVDCFSFCFMFYALRLFLISIITSPWTIVGIEFFLQGPTFALSYITIVAYANDIAPPGASATMQGIAAGLDDGLGYAFGSLLGGILYRYAGPRRTFQIFGTLSGVSGVAHFLIQKYGLRKIEENRIPEEVRFIKEQGNL